MTASKNMNDAPVTITLSYADSNLIRGTLMYTIFKYKEAGNRPMAELLGGLCDKLEAAEKATVKALRKAR